MERKILKLRSKMNKQIMKQNVQWYALVVAIAIYFSGIGMLHAQDANINGFQAANNKGVGYVFKEHSNGNWRGHHTAKVSADVNNLILGAQGDFLFKRMADGGETTTAMRLNTTGDLTGVNSITAGSINLGVLSADRINLKQNTKHNLGLGFNAGFGSITGYENTNVGSHSGGAIGTGNYNSNFGSNAGKVISTGRYNSNFGRNSGPAITTGSYNSNFGAEAGLFNVTGSTNSNFGEQAGRSINGTGNTSLGSRAGRDLTNVSYSVFLGYAAGADFGHVTFEQNKNPITGNKSVFVLNNQSQLHNPLLFGTFVDNQNHDDPTSRTEAGSMAQLAINTHHLVDSCALTVAGGVHIGPKDIDPASFPRDTLFSHFLLWVERGIVTEDLAIAQVAEWSDHVFGDDYALASLDEVEQFIREHGHLPNIPSEAEVRKSGYSLQTITARFLEKIEELTLHAIEQEKRIKEHHKRYDELALRLSRLEQKQ